MYKRAVFGLKKGFTLIELLVVVALIGILMAAGVVAFVNAQKGGRDARRQNDMRAIQNAFEQYYNGNDSKYSSTASDMAVGYFAGNSLPTDPKNSGSNVYTVTMSGVVGSFASGYCVCADLENNSKANSTSNTCAFASSGSLEYFCVSSRQ